jgi:cold shock CspA family protein
LPQHVKILGWIFACLFGRSSLGAWGARHQWGRKSRRVRNVTSRAMRKLDPDVFEVSGSVKWFDPAKGYGFILPDEHLPDILLHVSCLRRGGFQTAYEGSRIICDVVRTPKGLQAARIRGMVNSTAIRPAQLPQRTHVVVFAQSDWEKAVVKWFNRLRGFGFLTRGPETPDKRSKRSDGSRT